MHKEKMFQYLRHAIGGHVWIGRSILEVHSKLNITEDQFQTFYDCFIELVKELGPRKPKIIKEITKIINRLRDKVVKSVEPIQERSKESGKISRQSSESMILQKLGNRIGIRALIWRVQSLIWDSQSWPEMAHLVSRQDTKTLIEKYIDFIVCLVDENQQWQGMSMLEAHQSCQVDFQAHFERMILYFRTAAEEL